MRITKRNFQYFFLAGNIKRKHRQNEKSTKKRTLNDCVKNFKTSQKNELTINSKTAKSVSRKGIFHSESNKTSFFRQFEPNYMYPQDTSEKCKNDLTRSLILERNVKQSPVKAT